MDYRDQRYPNEDKWTHNIGCVKYTLFCFNVLSWIIGAVIFGLTIWIRAGSGFDEWVNILKISEYYIGIYLLLATAIIIMAISFLGCVSALMESGFALMLFIVSQVVTFLLVTVGSAVLLEFSTVNSSIQPLIRDTMRSLIMNSRYKPAGDTLRMIQENVGCCGADGPRDYRQLQQPLPMECRDTVTGNAFQHGCVDELTWFLEDKSVWIVGLAMCVAFLAVIQSVLSLLLIEMVKKEEEEASNYRR
ncbi:tetraspanin-2A [Condylostylus longicornis]|uniref:tetraspanin-2A n=1 Tax=Condylostylus longicornis TaxID=2530218 RepID=UPI00244E3CF8|nr:tetraspanin-2A [Condylostylus longicornis]